MKLSLTVEADTINVMALNLGRISVDIDDIELANLVDVVCDNGYSLRIADAPGKLIVEDPLPPVARLNGIQCSTAHITLEDKHYTGSDISSAARRQQQRLVLYTGYG